MQLSRLVYGLRISRTTGVFDIISVTVMVIVCLCWDSKQRSALTVSGATANGPTGLHFFNAITVVTFHISKTKPVSVKGLSLIHI